MPLFVFLAHLTSSHLRPPKNDSMVRVPRRTGDGDLRKHRSTCAFTATKSLSNSDSQTGHRTTSTDPDAGGGVGISGDGDRSRVRLLPVIDNTGSETLDVQVCSGMRNRDMGPAAAGPRVLAVKPDTPIDSSVRWNGPARGACSNNSAVAAATISATTVSRCSSSAHSRVPAIESDGDAEAENPVRRAW
jgi:hypothetical protein